jgi:hypothetical protein
MIALLAALALQSAPPPPTTRHIVLHVGGHALVTLHNAHLRRWSVAHAGIVSLSDIHTVKKDTAFRVDATNAGSTSVVIGCDKGGEEVWLVDVT